MCNSASSDNGSTDNESSSSYSDSSDSERKKEPSLSPLSKRMAMHSATLQAEASKQFNQPFYMGDYNSFAASTSNKNPNDFKLDDDDTEKRVRKLLQEASKHKKQKSKKSKKKKSKKSKKSSTKEKELLLPSKAAVPSKLDFLETQKAINEFNITTKINENLQMYEKSIAEIEKRQEILRQSLASSTNSRMLRDKSETPPKAPSMRLPPMDLPSSSRPFRSLATAPPTQEPPKFSFQIKKPVKMDKFGLVRIATPLAPTSPTYSNSRSRSRTRTRSRTLSRSHSRSSSRYQRRDSRRRSDSRDYKGGRGRQRSRSSSYERRRNRRSRSYTRSRSVSRSRYNYRGRRSPQRRDFYGRRRTPSPFVPRETPPPRRRHSRANDSPEPRRRTRSPRGPKFGNRVWHRPGYGAGDTPTHTHHNKASMSNERWLHDKFNEKADDGPSIEEIDEIINKAQKERKQEIISRDKDILKKNSAT